MEGAARLGFVLTARTSSYLTISLHGEVTQESQRGWHGNAPLSNFEITFQSGVQGRRTGYSRLRQSAVPEAV